MPVLPPSHQPMTRPAEESTIDAPPPGFRPGDLVCVGSTVDPYGPGTYVLDQVVHADYVGAGWLIRTVRSGRVLHNTDRSPEPRWRAYAITGASPKHGVANDSVLRARACWADGRALHWSTLAAAQAFVKGYIETPRDRNGDAFASPTPATDTADRGVLPAAVPGGTVPPGEAVS